LAAITAVTPVPLKVTPVAPRRFCPAIVAPMLVPGAPDDANVIELVVGATTVKPLRGAVVPEGVVTVTVREPRAAPGAIVIATDRLDVPGEVITAVTPVPLKVTSVAPNNSDPKMVPATVVPGTPDDGKTDEIAGLATVNPLEGEDVPQGVVTVMVREPRAAPDAIVTRIDAVVALAEVTTPVTPVPLKVTAVAPRRVGPERVAATVVPGAPDDGEIEVTDGTTTLNELKGAVAAEGVVRVTVRAPGAAPAAIVTSADTVVGCTEAITAVTPVPLKVRPVAPDKL